MSVRTGSRKDDLRAFIQMTTEAIEFCKAEGEDYTRQAEVLAQYTAELADLEARGVDTPGMNTATTEGTGTARPLHARPQAGAPASNQYGTFTVHYASEKQTAFIKSLMDRKDLSKIEDSVTLDVARLREQVANLQVNKKAASAIIDRLLALPDAAPVAGAPALQGEKATDKQVALIRRLAGEKEMSADDRAKVLAAVDTLSKKGASATIDKMFALPKAVAPVTEIEAGVYTDGSVTYRVYLGQQSGKMLAARVIEHEDGTAEFDYAGQADRFVTAAFRRLTIEEAARFGKATGTCIVCARRLDVPESVDRGIGPVCFAKMGG